MTLETRIKIEKRLARETVKTLLGEGFLLAVHNGASDNSYEVGPTSHQGALFSALGHTDEEHIFVFQPDDLDHPIGWVFLVYGNDGYDLINDHTVNLESYLLGVSKLADELEARHA